MKWLDLATALKKIREVLLVEWRCGLPGSQLPGDSDEAQCDAWCAKLAEQPDEPLSPPPNVRPWIVARLLMGEVIAAELGQRREPFPPNMPPKSVVRQLLIGDWHADLKYRWRLIRGQQSFSA